MKVEDEEFPPPVTPAGPAKTVGGDLRLRGAICEGSHRWDRTQACVAMCKATREALQLVS